MRTFWWRAWGQHVIELLKRAEAHMKLAPAQPVTVAVIVVSLICTAIWGYGRVTDADFPLWLDVLTILAMGAAFATAIWDGTRRRETAEEGATRAGWSWSDLSRRQKAGFLVPAVVLGGPLVYYLVAVMLETS